MKPEEWAEAYTYLLQRLRETQANSSFIVQIEQASALRVEEVIVAEQIGRGLGSKLG